VSAGDAVFAALAGILGLIFGSFGTVVAHRIPRRESFVRGRSKCPACGQAIAVRDNLPVLSFLVQRGRCRNCRAPISWRYPAMEIATAVLFVTAALRFGISIEAVVYAALFWTLVVLAAIDLEHKLLPNRVVFPAFVVGWAGLALGAIIDGSPERLIDAGIGAVTFGGVLFLVAFISTFIYGEEQGMGWGDVKLAFVLGTFLGYIGGIGVTLVGMFLAFLLGGVTGVVIMVATGGNRRSQLPFGPFLASGTIIAIVAGIPLLNAYLGSF
jgi:leader peptidase (prepilin peptidase)/N-methyltransferase